jgi:hypothetical protein
MVLCGMEDAEAVQETKFSDTGAGAWMTWVSQHPETHLPLRVARLGLDGPTNRCSNAVFERIIRDYGGGADDYSMAMVEMAERVLLWRALVPEEWQWWRIPGKIRVAMPPLRWFIEYWKVFNPADAACEFKQ